MAANEHTVSYEFTAQVNDIIAKLDEIKKFSKQVTDNMGDGFDKETKKINSAFKTLNVKPFSQIKVEIDKANKAYETLKNSGKVSAQELSIAHKNMEAQVKTLNGEMQGLGKTSGFLKNQFESLKGVIAGAAFTFFTKGALDQFAEFDTAMRNVWTLTDQTKAQMDSMGDSIRAMSLELPSSATDMANAMYEIVSAGVDTADAMKVLEISTKAGIAGLTDTATAAKLGLSVTAAYGKSTDDLASVFDNLFFLVKKGVTNFQEVSQYLGQISTVAQSAGISLEELTAELGLLTQRGIKLPQAVTGLRSAIFSLINPSKETADEMERTGVVWKGLLPTLEQLKAKGYTTAEQLGKLGIPKESITSLLVAVNTVDQLGDAMANTGKLSGTMFTAADKQLGSYKNQVQLLKNNFEFLQTTIGKDLVPVVLKLTDALILLLKAFNNIPGPIRQIILAFVGFKAAMAGFSVAKDLLSLPKTFASIAGAAEASAGGVASAMTASKLAIGAMAAYGAVQIGILVKEIYRYWQEYKKVWKNTHDFDAEVKAFEKFKDFKTKSNAELQQLDIDDLQDYGDNLAKHRAYLNNRLSQLQKEAANPFNVLIGRDKAAEQKKIQDALDQTENQMQEIIRQKQGIKVDIPVTIESKVQQESLNIEQDKSVEQERQLQALEGQAKEYEKIFNSQAKSIKTLTGINVTSNELLGITSKATTAQEALNLLKDQNVKQLSQITGKESTLLEFLGVAINSRKQLVNIEKETVGLQAEKLSMLSKQTAEVQKTGATAEKTKKEIEDIFNTLLVESTDKTGFIMNQAKELFAFIGGETIKLDIDAGSAEQTLKNVQALTEEQKRKFIEANSAFKIIDETAQGIGKVFKQVGDDVKSTTQDIQDMNKAMSQQEVESPIVSNLSDQLKNLKDQKKEIQDQVADAEKKRADLDGIITGLTSKLETFKVDAAQLSADLANSITSGLIDATDFSGFIANLGQLEVAFDRIFKYIGEGWKPVIESLQQYYQLDETNTQAWLDKKRQMVDEYIKFAQENFSKLQGVAEALPGGAEVAVSGAPTAEPETGAEISSVAELESLRDEVAKIAEEAKATIINALLDASSFEAVNGNINATKAQLMQLFQGMIDGYTSTFQEISTLYALDTDNLELSLLDQATLYDTFFGTIGAKYQNFVEIVRGFTATVQSLQQAALGGIEAATAKLPGTVPGAGGGAGIPGAAGAPAIPGAPTAPGATAEGSEADQKQAEILKLDQLIAKLQQIKAIIDVQMADALNKKTELDEMFVATSEKFNLLELSLIETTNNLRNALASVFIDILGVENISKNFDLIQQGLQRLYQWSISQAEAWVSAIAATYDKDLDAARAYIQEKITVMSEGLSQARESIKQIGDEISSVYNDIQTKIEGVNSAVAKLQSQLSKVNEIRAQVDAQAESIKNSRVASTRFATGGSVPGVGNSDSVPALLTPGEFVMKAQAVKKYGLSMMSALNQGMLNLKMPSMNMPRQRFATGGAVNPTINNNNNNQVKIVNVVSPDMILDAIASQPGQDMIINIIDANKEYIR